MKELKDHLREICRMIEEENSHFLSLLEKVKKRSERLNRFPCGFFPEGNDRKGWEEEKRL
jgi:hypothetical protein